MPFPLEELGGTGSPMHWAPANGFPPASYRPLLEPLAAWGRLVSLPPRALWPAMGPPPERPGSWETLAEDLVSGLAEHRLTEVILLGHSFGAVVSLIAAARHRERFRGLVLLDPTILSDAIFEQFGSAKETDWRSAPHPLAPRTRERRAAFPTRAAAFEYFRGRKLFTDWADRSLEAFVDAGLRPDHRGGYVLAWSPAWEAHYYESIHLGVWDDVARLDPTLPVLVVAGSGSDTFLPATLARFMTRVPWAEMAMVNGGHLFPQSAPEATAAVIGRWLGSLAPNGGV